MNESQPEPPDKALIAAMGRQEEDPEAARAAFGVFFDRHCDYLLKHLERVNYQLDGYAVDIGDVGQDVFEIVWTRGHASYDPDRRTAGVSEEASTRSWLTQIALRVVQNHMRRRSLPPLDPGSDNEDMFAEPWVADQVTNMVSLHQFVEATLSREDATLVWFKMRYYDAETGLSTPDPDAKKQFCAQHDLTDAAFRQRYKRAIDTLRLAAAAVQL